jgi:hypothetical protein
MIPRFTLSFLLVLLLIPTVSAQSTSGTSATSAEAKKAREDRDKKALALVDQIISDSESLRLPENRVRIDIALADSIWPRDERRARLLFKQAAAALADIHADGADRSEQDYVTQVSQQLRQEMLQVAGNHDPRLALEFLRASRPATPMPQQYWQPNYESHLEMTLAMQVAQKDAREALSIGEDSLKLGLGQDVTSLLYALNSRDKVAAQTFLNDILKQIRTGENSKSQAAPYIALTLLRNWIDANRQTPDQSVERVQAEPSIPNLNIDTARELCGVIINVVLNNGLNVTSSDKIAINVEGEGFVSYPGQLLGMIQQLKPMLADLEKLAPSQFPALSKKIAEFDKFNEASQGPWVRYQKLTETGTADEILQAAKNAPPGISDGLVNQAAWKAISQGDADAAQRIIEKISDPRQRTEMELNLARRSFERARSEQKLTEARALLARFPPEERAVLLAQMAASVANDNKQTALGMMSEAEGLLGDRAQNYQALSAQLQLASAYERLDMSRSAALVQRAINQLNELAAAAIVLNGFDLQQYFRHGEFVIRGGNSLNEMARQTGERLASMTRSDFDRAKSTAEQFQRPELRMMALLQVAQAALANDGQ